jgi:RNA polymerase-binding transcription factor DksA
MAKNILRKRKRKKPYNSIGYTTGDIGLNIDFFNKRMGTADTLTDIATPSGTANSETSGESSGALCEAKRYVRRYYIRPQNIFCSNKAEILKALIELDDANCSVYTLNNLGDDKDVSKLMNSDIIYYYDDGILYDKNRVKVMDYDLSIKKEEERKHFANVNNAPEKEFKAEYEGRMTDATELEEAFNLDFDAVNAYGEKLTEAKEAFCCICGEPIEGHGNNPEPYMPADEGRCCDACNVRFVIPARLDMED